MYALAVSGDCTGDSMEGSIPHEFVDELRSRLDIVDLVSQYVQIKKSGRNFFGLCPFHGEKTPSFSVSQDKQIFHCFGCGEGGNVFAFLMKMEGLTFPESVKELARRAGIPLPRVELSPGEVRRQERRQRLQEAMNLAARYYRHMLSCPDGSQALAYLKKRGLSHETVERFALGYAPDGWENLKSILLRQGYQERDLVDAGLLTDGEKKTYDRFRNRIMFPICSPRGDVIAFGGRVLGEGTPKYLNSPETPLFDKGKNLYALHVAREAIRRQKQAVIFEGYMDVIAAHQAGITNAVASLGTSLTDAQARLLRGQAEEAVIVYDADAAGQAATWRGLQVLRQAGCLVKVGSLPQGFDPDDYIRRYGGEAFVREIVGKAQLLVDYQLSTLAKTYNLEKGDDRIRFFDKILDVLASVENAMEREDYLQKTASLLQLPAASIREELRKKSPAGIRRTPARPVAQAPVQSDGAEKVVLQLLALWARFPQLAVSAVSSLKEDDIPADLQIAYARAKEYGSMFSPACLMDVITTEKYRQILSRLLIDEEYEEKIANKAIHDLIKRIQCVRIVRRRRELETRMAELDPVAAKGEIMELSKEWLELRKMEETINHPREGGKGVG